VKVLFATTTGWKAEKMKDRKFAMENKEVLAKKIYDCAEREHSAFIAEMKTHDTDYIVEHAYEIVIMDDLRMIFEEDDLPLPALQELDKVEKPLASIYDEWLKNDGGHMELLRDTVNSFAEKRMRNTADRLYADPVVPRYGNTYREACEADEMHLYRASRRRDIECLRYYEKHISDAHENQRIKAFTQEWAELYGRDRCKFVLGYTVKRADWDARYAPEAKRDAQQYDYQRSKENDPFSEYGTNVHPCLVDSSYRILMEMERNKSKEEKER